MLSHLIASLHGALHLFHTRCLFRQPDTDRLKMGVVFYIAGMAIASYAGFEELGWYFGVEEGLLVVRAPGDDDLLDLRSGDVIVSIDGRRPRSQTQLVRILRSYEEGESMQFTIMRQREEITIEVTVPERDVDFFWRRERQ